MKKPYIIICRDNSSSDLRDCEWQAFTSNNSEFIDREVAHMCANELREIYPYMNFAVLKVW
jgi:hypothetical protein